MAIQNINAFDSRKDNEIEMTAPVREYVYIDRYTNGIDNATATEFAIFTDFDLPIIIKTEDEGPRATATPTKVINTLQRELYSTYPFPKNERINSVK